MKRRLMVIILSLTLIFTLIPMTAFADDGGTKAGETVTKTGKVKGVKKGSCYIYAYAQNGVAKKIKVTVK